MRNIIYFILCLLLPVVAWGQKKRPCLNIRYHVDQDYTQADAEQDFECLERQCDKDTVFVHRRHAFPQSALTLRAGRAHRVYLFDSTAVIGQKAKSILDTLMQVHVQNIEKVLLGTWDWEWSGTNGLTDDPWGESPAKCTCTQRMEIGRDSISFWRNDTLERRAAYALFIPIPHIGRKFVNLQIENEDCWAVEISDTSNAFLAKEEKGTF